MLALIVLASCTHIPESYIVRYVFVVIVAVL